MKRYDEMTVTELVMLIRLQDRIINSMIRELQISRADKRKRKKTYKKNDPEFGAKVRKGRLASLSPERRREIASLGGQATKLKRQQAREIKETEMSGV